MVKGKLHLIEGIAKVGGVVMLNQNVLDAKLFALIEDRLEVKSTLTASADASLFVQRHILEMYVLESIIAELFYVVESIIAKSLFCQA